VQRDLRIIRLAILAELRNPALRLLGVLAAIGAAAYAWQQGPAAASTAVVLTGIAGRGFALACCLWFATGALRDQDSQLGAVLRSKPVDGGRWVLINWATGIGVWLALLALLFLAAALAQLPAAGVNSLAAHGVALVRSSVTMVVVATVGFCLTRVTRSPLGASIIVLAFLCVMAGLQLVPPFLRPDYSQNTLLFLASGAVLLALTGFFVERFRRGELRSPAFSIVGLLLCAGAAYGGGSQAYQASQPPAEGSVPDVIALQHLETGRRLPGFWLPDGRGHTVRTADYPGKVLMVFLFAADDLEAARTLTGLDVIAREYGSRGIQPIGVCMSSDKLDGAALSWTGGYRFPVASDRTTTKTTSPPESSMAVAYDAQVLPMLVMTNRHRKVVEVLKEPSISHERLRALVEQRLREEPE
jgi:hypothetical protein